MVNGVQNLCNPSIYNFQSALDRIPSYVIVSVSVDN